MSEQNIRQNNENQPHYIHLAQKEELSNKLKELELDGVLALPDSISHTFINQVAGSRKVPSGVFLAWQTAIFTGLEEAPVEDHQVLQKYYNRQFYKVVDAIIPDSKIAAITKEHMHAFEDFNNKSRK